MAECTFSIPFEGTAVDLKAKIETAVVQAKGTFEGDASAGKFSLPTPLGQIKGSYNMNDASPINIQVSEKPFFVSCKQIESKLMEYLNPVNG